VKITYLNKKRKEKTAWRGDLGSKHTHTDEKEEIRERV